MWRRRMRLISEIGFAQSSIPVLLVEKALGLAITKALGDAGISVSFDSQSLISQRLMKVGRVEDKGPRGHAQTVDCLVG